MRVAPLAAVVLLPLALAGAPAFGQTPGEISFWESVRDSKNPAELQAYIAQYPNGAFVALARARLAALRGGPAPAAQPQEAPVRPAQDDVRWPLPQPGDSWTYRWREGKGTGAKEHTMVVTVASASAGTVVDQATIDGATPPIQSNHFKGSYIFSQGASVYSPYLPMFATLRERGSPGRLQFLDAACTGRQVCDGKARIYGKEPVSVPAGFFVATRVSVEQTWAPAFFGAAGARGGRTLTAWYAPEVRRVVKYTSRAIVGGAPMETDFEIELVSFQVK